MGVRGLESYMMSIPKGYISVNILDEIIEFKKCVLLRRLYQQNAKFNSFFLENITNVL